jgi:hypothetical protein
MKADNLRKRYLKPELAASGLPQLTLHELRHTYASIMLHEWHVEAAVVCLTMAKISGTFGVRPTIAGRARRRQPPRRLLSRRAVRDHLPAELDAPRPDPRRAMLDPR